MSVETSNVLNKLLNDKTIGAGNFAYKIYEQTKDKSKSLIYLDQPIINHKNQTISELSIDYIINTATQYASYYYKIGIRAKELVILYFDESIEYFLQFIALTRLGAIPVLLNDFLNVETVALLTEKSNAKYIITNNNKINALFSVINIEKYDLNILNINELLIDDEASEFHVFNHDDDDTIMLAHTSGTTGLPKLVQFTHASMFYGVKVQINKQPGERILSLLPHSHGSALVILMSALLRSIIIKTQVNKKPMNVLKSIEEFRPDLVVAFPKTFVDLCRHDLSNYDLNSIQYWLSTGDANHETHVKKLIENGSHFDKGIKKKGSIFIDNLGSTEFSFAIFRNIHTTESTNYDRCIGKPFDWAECAILSENGTFLSENEVGYLGVKSKSLTKGYWNNSYLSEKNRINGFWLSGDLAYRDKNGFYYHLDRISDKIQTDQGVFYSCQSEEWVLKNLTYIFDISFVGLNKINHDVEIVAFVELILSSEIKNAITIKNEINKCLTKNNWPIIQRVVFRSAHCDVGITGKKLKKKIREELI